MPTYKFSNVLNGKTPIKTPGGPVPWTIKQSGGTYGYLGYLDLYSNKSGLFNSTTVLKGLNWTLGFLEIHAKGNNKAILRDKDAKADRTIKLLELGKNSDVDLKSTKVKVIYGDDGGARHDVKLGSASTDLVDLQAKVNIVKTGTGWVNMIETENKANVNVGAGGAGTIKTGNGADIVKTTSKYVDAIRTNEGKDKVTIGAGGAGSVSTGDDNDTVTVNGYVHYLRTGMGNDKITVNSDAGIVRTDEGDDTVVTKTKSVKRIETGDGADTVTIGSGGAKTVKTDEGADVVTTGSGYVARIDTGDQNDQVTTGTGHVDMINTGDHDDTVTTGGTVEVINTGSGADTVTTHDWVGYLRTGDGADIVTLNSHADMVRTGEGNDQISSGAGYVRALDSGEDDDTVTIGSGGAAFVDTGSGADTVTTGTGFVEVIKTSGGNDTVTVGSAGADYVKTGDNDDTVTLGAGYVQFVHSGEGMDTVTMGSGGLGKVNLGGGEDRFVVAAGPASQGVQVVGGGGSDTIDFSGFTGGVVFTLDSSGIWQNPGAPGGDIAVPASGYVSETSVENIIGTGFADTLTGGTGAEVNTITAGAGADIVQGNGGADILDVGVDADVDTLVFTSKDDSTAADRDTVQNFVVGTDKIDLAAIDGDESTGGVNDALVFSGTPNVANSVWVEVSGSDEIVKGDVDGDGTADFEILIQNVSGLSATDLILS